MFDIGTNQNDKAKHQFLFHRTVIFFNAIGFAHHRRARHHTQRVILAGSTLHFRDTPFCIWKQPLGLFRETTLSIWKTVLPTLPLPAPPNY
jgi:hypothetical protein